MDDRQVAKEMLKDFMVTHSIDLRPVRCPFVKEYNGVKTQHHELCAVVFSGWGRKYLVQRSCLMGIQAYALCPCNVMSKRYVRRKARAFVAKK